MIVGYFRRVDDGDTSATTVLRAERCLRIESDAAGRREARTQLIGDLVNGDVLVSPSMTHLAASTTELLRVAQSVLSRGATLRLVSERLDTSVAAARNVLVTLAAFDRRLLNDLRATGIYEASLRGALPGRPRKLDDDTLAMVRDELAAGRSYASVARSLGVHPTTLMRQIRRLHEGEGGAQAE